MNRKEPGPGFAPTCFAHWARKKASAATATSARIYLMKMFGVGRPAIREGLFSLQKIGLLTVGSGSKARVTVPTASKLVKSLSGAAKLLLAQPNGVRNLQDGRHLFEVALAKLAASKATAHDIRRLGTALEENRRCLNDLVKFGEKKDCRVSLCDCCVSQNPVFTVIFKAFAEWLTGAAAYRPRESGSGRAHDLASSTVSLMR